MGGMVEGRSRGRISVRLERTQVGGAERRMKQPKLREKTQQLPAAEAQHRPVSAAYAL